MRYCHECGAEVAPEDVFCLYCGIALEPVVAATPDAEISAVDAPADISAALENISRDAATTPKTAAELDVPDAVEPPFVEIVPLASPDDKLVNSVPAAQSEEFSESNPVAHSLELSSQPMTEPDALLALASDVETNLPETTSSPKVPPMISPEKKQTETAEGDEPETVLNQSAPTSFAENLSADWLPDPLLSPSEEIPAEDSSASIENAEKLATPIARAVLRDEDLQPTLIGQSAKLLLPDEDEDDAHSILPVKKGEDEKSKVEKSEELNVLPSKPFAPSTQTISAEQSLSAPAIEGGEISSPPPLPQSVELLVEPIAVTTTTPEPARPTENRRTPETPSGGGKSPKLKPLDLGSLLNNRYKVVKRIGGGGMGAVYLAEDQNLGGVLRAVKEMVQAYVDESQQEKAVADFRRESVLLTQLEHPSIPTIYDYFFDEANGRFYLVMKYIAGGDLAGRLRSTPEGKLDEGSVTMWAIQIADVLDYLHNRQPPIVYRDLKPSNIMLDGSNNKAMLIDFGIARWVNKEEKGVTAVGTMGYAPPELFAGNAEPRSDIYSLGATMFHLLTGADPQSNPLLIFDFTKNPRPRQINLTLSVEIEDILLQAVEYNAGLRFESAEKVRDALTAHLERLKAGRLTFERSSQNIAQVMPIPAQAPPSVPFASQPPVNMVFCGFCGEKIIGTDMFCAYCGAPQGSAAPNATAAGTPSPAPLSQMQQTMLSSSGISGGGAATARLVVLGTTELDAPLFKLEKENNLVGREDRRANIFPEVDLSKFDHKAQVSRRHARIWRDGAAFMVEDLKSSNGTVLITDDNQTVRLQAHQPHVLQHGDKLKLGDTVLRFYVN